MMRWVVDGALRFRLLVVALGAAVLVAGVQQSSTMPVDALPEFAPPQIEVQTEALGLSAPEVESLVTLNLEELLNGTPWLTSIHSTSVPGLSSILLSFEPGTDILRARQLVQERLTLSFAIPNVAKPPIIIQPLSTTNRVMMVGLSSRKLSPLEVGVLARWNIRPALLAVPGVANVAIWGQRERQLQVQVQPQKLLAADVTLDQVVRTTGNAMWVSPLTFLQASTPGSGGWIDTPSQRLEVRHIFPISTAADLAKVGVDGAAPLKLSDIATVTADHQPLIGDAFLTGNEDSLIVIEKFPGANTLDVTRGVEAAFAKLKPGLADIDVDTSVSKPATYIDDSISNLQIALIAGAVLLIAALGWLLHGWRSGVIAAFAIPVSLAAALLVLDLRGETVNLMIVAGLLIALGILVDDAVGSTRTIAARVRADREAGRETPAHTVVLDAAVEARRGLVYATLIALLPLLPYLFSEGVDQAVAEPLVLSLVFAVLASLVVSLTVTPALAMLLLTHGATSDGPGSPLLGRLRARYTPLVEGVVRAPRTAFLASAAVLVLALAAAPFFTQSLLPSFHDRNLVVRWTAAPGTSEPEMARLTARVGTELQSIPGVAHVGAHLGRAVLGDQTVDVNSAELWVTVKGDADYSQTVSEVRDAVSGYPGVSENVSTYLDERVRHFDTKADTGTGKDITVRVDGPAFGTLRATANHVRDMLSHVDGVSDLQVDEPPLQPNIEVEVNLAKAKLYGLKPGDVRRAAATMLAGLEVGSLFQQQKVFQVVVWSTPESRSSLSSIKNLLIDTPSGGHVRLEDVADVRISPTSTVIERDAVSRRIDIGLNASGRDPGAVVSDIDRKLASTPMPLEYHAEVIGTYRSAEMLHRRMFASGLAALVGIFLLLQAAFGSWRLAALFTLTLPVSLSGGVLAAFLFRADMALPTLAGFIAVLAVAVRGGIAVLTRAGALEAEDGRRTRATAVVEAAGERLAPLLTTAVATMVALVPLIVTGTIPGQEIAQPIAIVVFGGLITTTLVTAFVVPAIYAVLGPRREAEEPSPIELATT
jgi:CzcA family heavy metal efflux pump